VKTRTHDIVQCESFELTNFEVSIDEYLDMLDESDRKLEKGDA